MAEHPLAMASGDTDDLPRTLRREREAREREAREREFQMAAPQPIMAADREPATPAFADDLQPASVRRLDIPFTHLMLFCLKAVVAAIPALILLTAILWLFGQALQTFFPQLVKMQILIRFPH